MSMMKCCVLIVGLTLAACSSDDEDCALPPGKYAVVYTAVSGDCPTPKDMIVNVNPERVLTVPDGCTASHTFSGCTTSLTLTCDRSDGAFTVSGTFTWDDGDAVGTGSEDWTVRRPDGATACRGTFTTRYTKL